MLTEFLPPLSAGLAASVLAAYLLGSVAFGVIIAKIMNLGDLSRLGSGNIGATNVLRTGSKPAAALTLLLDSGKGAAGAVLGYTIGGDSAAYMCGLAAFLGHLFPFWRHFKGGKGVATYLGLVLIFGIYSGLATCIVWIAFAAAFRYSSLASLASAAISIPLLWGLENPEASAYAALMAALIFWAHRSNIARLRCGKESKIELKRQPRPHSCQSDQ